MSEFDAERYLRLAGERALLSGQDQAHDSPLLGAARALVAVDAIALQDARRVIADYELASALRGEGYARHAGMQDPEEEPVGRALAPRRVVACGCTIEQPRGTLYVRHVSLGAEATDLAVTFYPTQASTPRATSGIARAMMMRARRAAGMHPSGPDEVTLVDDRGASVEAGFNGGGSASEWRGHLRSEEPLAQDTAWIEVDGERMELTARAPAVDVSVEELAADDPARRYLWQLAANPGHFRRSPEVLTPAIDALLAAGALSPEDTTPAQARAVVAQLSSGAGTGSATANQLPEPWRSLLARSGVQDGARGEIAIGATTPLFDGVSVAITALEADEGGFTLEVEASPGLDVAGPFDSNLRPNRLTWWAADDRGNKYLGEIGMWGSNEGYAQGEIRFWPALDAQAQLLELLLTAARARAVIRVALAWAGADEERRA